jgi:hypothetical protein
MGAIGLAKGVAPWGRAYWGGVASSGCALP